jgi:hypothetical protein
MKLLGEDGFRVLNEVVLRKASDAGLLDYRNAAADTTAMKDLAPQIAHWLDTGRVAKKKIVNLLMREVHSVPRGKVGKDVEFGLKWGLIRYAGGFVFGRVDPSRGNFNDKKHVPEVVDDTERIFGDALRRLAYDRGGHSAANVRLLRKRGIEPGLAPAGSAPWPIDGAAKRRAKRERVKVEGSIGAVKSRRYNFNKPNVRSTHMMMTAGQSSIFGYNLNRLVTLTAAKDRVALTGA